ncbi:HAD-IA family hydrolase [Fulvivirga sp. M361]|uniref:HAD family hydrolase n=1 Tax=Fulvivirga sp. M361 TaxID=2594266 RepID=UPI001179D2C7|nr:HAD-IA family hydrolase [Fulvivirga sp. M361]TRX59511.1 HAD-IA family hydrolase [Fulvivirga sp. M361]
MIQQIIFDCDGVLVDTEIVAAEVVTNKLSPLGISISVEEYLNNHTGKTLTSILSYLEIKPEANQSIIDFAEEIEREIYSNLKVIKGMPELLRSLPLPIALASNSNIWQVEKAIKFLNIGDIIGEHYFSAEMVEHPKPHPDVYLHAAKTTKKSPDDCLVIEDSLSGAKSAIAAGMQVIGFCGASHILKGHDKKLKETGVHHLAYSPTELKSIIKSVTTP